MNSLERYLAMLEGRETDFPARIPILMAFAAEHIGSNYGAFASDHRVLVEANIRCAEDFGLDQLSTISDPYRETEGFGGEIEYVRDGVPRCHCKPLEAEEELDASSLPKPDPMDSVRMRDRIDAVRLYHERAAGRYSIMGWVEGPAAEACDLRGMENFFLDLLEEPEASGELMDLCVDVGIEFARCQVESGADTIGIGDAACSQMSAELYAERVLPRQQRLVEAIRGMGAWVRLHICGNITHLLPYIAGLDVNIVDIDWQVDMAHARETLGKGKVLAGNLDPVNAVMKSNPETIRRRMGEIYTQVGDPFMVNAGCEIPPGTDPENLRALCEPLTAARLA